MALAHRVSEKYVPRLPRGNVMCGRCGVSVGLGDLGSWLADPTWTEGGSLSIYGDA